MGRFDNKDNKESNNDGIPSAARGRTGSVAAISHNRLMGDREILNKNSVRKRAIPASSPKSNLCLSCIKY